MSEEQRFWAKVRKTTSCWLWQASFGGSRYGVFKRGQKCVKAHRLAWELMKGPIPHGMRVLHKCDVPACVNPAHLFLGTQADNVIDMEAKGRGRHPAGSQNAQSKLREPDVMCIKQSDESLMVLAKRYGVTKQTIHKIRHGITWSHV